MATESKLPRHWHQVVGLASIIVVVAGLRAIAPLLNEVLIALILALTLLPLLEWLIRRRLPPTLALVVTLAIVLVVGAGVLSVLGLSLAQLRERIPQYQERLSGVLQTVQGALERKGVDISGLISGNVISAERIATLAQGTLGAFSSFLSAASLIFLLVVLFLAEMPLVQRLAARGSQQRWLTVATGVRKYISITGLTGLINAGLNLLLLLALGVDFAVVWAVLCFFFNFIPAVGNLLALAPPALLAFLEFGWQRAVWVVAGFVVTNIIVDNLIKPRFMKQGLDISPLVVILSIMFWGWVLGPAGSILAVPLTLALQSFFASSAAEPA